jgi:hypothetical protein
LSHCGKLQIDEERNILSRVKQSQMLTLLFVGHISLAFLIVFFISARFGGIRKTVSIALVMFLSILPDSDMIFRLAGIDLGHRTITHSPIIWLVIGGILFSLFTIKYRKSKEAAVYFIAYLSHLVIGDILVGPINILYPIGDLVINSPIKSVQYLLLETFVFTLMATVVIRSYYLFKKRNEDTLLFSYHSIIDSFLYPVLILAVSTSIFYMLAKFQLNLLETYIVVPLHFAAILIIMLMWQVSKKTKKQKHILLK